MNAEQPERRRLVTWEDPLIGASAAPTMSGLDYLRAIIVGAIPPPPIASLLGMDLIEVEAGRAVFGITPAEFHYNPIGVVHGGVACTLFDSALGCAVHSMLPAGAGYTTLEVKVNFLRPLTSATGPVRCEAKAIYVGGRTATAEARLADAAGKLYGHATTTCMVFRPE
ncbi:MAG TPA: PaaI family thioesterase [Herpetosiphonaceae bacterium]|nr:PaaI family thioesterase [Herpetosiphonaceae bacterium]